MKKMIVAITGRKRHGKDTIADYITRVYPEQCVKLSFAGPLKEACRHMFNFNDDQLYGDLKETVDPNWNITPRAALQFVGTDLVRNQMNKLVPNIGSNFWIKLLENQINTHKDKIILIPDVRFPNELEFLNSIKDSKVLTIKVRRNLNNLDSHDSEKHIDDLQTQYTLDNNGSLQDLYNQVDKLIF